MNSYKSASGHVRFGESQIYVAIINPFHTASFVKRLMQALTLPVQPLRVVHQLPPSQACMPATR